MTIDEEKLRAAFVDMKAEMGRLRARVEYLESHAKLFVPERELDTPNGNPKITFSPKRWIGENFVGKNYAECSPDFLEFLAETLAWMADHPQPGKERYSEGTRRNAARARSWARRLRAGGWTPPPPLEKPERGAGRPTRAPRTERPARPTRERPARGRERPSLAARPAAGLDPGPSLGNHEDPRAPTVPETVADLPTPQPGVDYALVGQTDQGAPPPFDPVTGEVHDEAREHALPSAGTADFDPPAIDDDFLSDDSDAGDEFAFDEEPLR